MEKEHRVPMAVCGGDPVSILFPIRIESRCEAGPKLARQDSCKISTLSLASKTTGIHTQDHECVRYVWVGTMQHTRMYIKIIIHDGWI